MNKKLIESLQNIKGKIEKFSKIDKRYYPNHRYYKKNLKELRFELTGELKKIEKLGIDTTEIKLYLLGFLTITYPSSKDCENVIDKIRYTLQDLELECNKDNNVFYIDGNKPWTDRNSLFPEFIKRLEGEILILDSYYGLGTLHILSQFPKNKKIRFLSGQLGTWEKQSEFSKEFIGFKKEFQNIELKVYTKFYELHDRYLISDNFLVLIGHGLKDVGNKECFLIALPSNEVSEIIKNLRQKFEERWIKSNNIT